MAEVWALLTQPKKNNKCSGSAGSVSVAGGGGGGGGVGVGIGSAAGIGVDNGVVKAPPLQLDVNKRRGHR